MQPDESPPFEPASVHRPVLRDEVVSWLDPKPGSILVDGTAGAGGHSRALAERVGTTGRVIGLDRDPAMRSLAAKVVEGLPVTLVGSSYADLPEALEDLGIAGGRVDGIVLDLGLSSDQLAWSNRGFSFGNDGPLDMRFDTESDDPTAADLVNTLEEVELARIFFEYGEERYSRRVARRIVEVRRTEPFETTMQFAAVVRRGIAGKWGKIDPATRVFQALRIAVNHELEHLEAFLAFLPDVLQQGGRAAIISFHSLEDRRVKHAFRNEPRLEVLTRKPVIATAEEQSKNPRSRSAKMRVVERCPIQSDPIPITATQTPDRRRRRAR